jgi:hypothetical protein
MKPEEKEDKVKHLVPNAKASAKAKKQVGTQPTAKKQVQMEFIITQEGLKAISDAVNVLIANKYQKAAVIQAFNDNITPREVKEG